MTQSKGRTQMPGAKKNSFIHVSSLNFCRRFGNTLRFLFSLERPPGSHVSECECGPHGSLFMRCHCCRRWWLLVVCRSSHQDDEKRKNIQSIDLNKVNGAPLSNHLSHSECLWQFVSKIRSQNPSAEMCFKCKRDRNVAKRWHYYDRTRSVNKQWLRRACCLHL